MKDRASVPPPDKLGDIKGDKAIAEYQPKGSDPREEPEAQEVKEDSEAG